MYIGGPPGSTRHNVVRRVHRVEQTINYVAGNSNSSGSGGVSQTYLEAASVEGDTILEQSETEYDDAGQVILTTTRQRFHNATGTGELVLKIHRMPSTIVRRSRGGRPVAAGFEKTSLIRSQKMTL